MRKTSLIKLSSAIIISSAILLTGSCKKKTNEVDSETQSVVDNSICEQEFTQIQPTTNNLAVQTKGTSAKKMMEGFALAASCDTLTYISGDTTYTNLLNPPIWEFNFGNCSAASNDGLLRSGKIIVKFLGRPKVSGNKTIIKFQNYKVLKSSGIVSYNCDSIVVTTGASSATSKSFNVDVVNAVCSGADWTIHFHSSKSITIDNNGTPLVFADDKTTVAGTSGGINRAGRKFDVVVNNIVKPNNWKHIVSGSLDLTPEGLSKRVVDYGNGAYDDLATYTVNGQTISFTLK
jgi:hypothetical protein